MRFLNLLCLLILTTSVPGQDSGPIAFRPNLVVFLVDDMGWQDTSVPFWVDPETGEETRTRFNDLYRTPNMERLAAQGVRFTNAYATALCSATRTSLMTGLNAARHRVTMWTLYPDRDQSGKTTRLQSPPDWKMEGLQPTDRTLARLLQQAGYRTIHVGKAHWGAIGTAGSDPTHLGFDRNIAGHATGGPGSHHARDGFGADKKVWAVPGLDRYHGLEVSLTEALTIEANREVEEAVAENRPFYLYLAHYAVHAPIQAHDPYVQKYRDQGLDEKEARYASMIEAMDASLGAVLKNLDRLGVAENTIVLFASDNGGLSVQGRGTSPYGTGANTHNWPLRSGKGSAYEGGTRIPQIVSWAKPDPTHPAQQRIQVERGGVRHLPTIVEDFFPTLLRWGGVDPPDPLVDGIDTQGLDFTGMLRPHGEQRQAGANSFDALRRQRPLLWHFPHDWGPAGPDFEPFSAMRLGDWKVIYFYQPRKWELYDLVHDLSEEHDRAAEEPQRLRRMAARMIAELEEADAQYPVQRQGGMPEPPLWLASDWRSGNGGTPLVLIPGWSCDRSTFDELLAALPPEQAVLRCDLPGCGASLAPLPPNGEAAYCLAGSADAVVAMMDQHGVETAVLVGHSNGGPVAREILRRHPNRVAGVVAVEAPLRPMIAPERIAGFVEVLRSPQRNAALSAIAGPWLAGDAWVDRQQSMLRMIEAVPVAVQVATLQATVSDDAWLPVEWNRPLLVVNAASPSWDPPYQDFVRSLGKDVDYREVPGALHMLPISHAQLLADTIVAWMKDRDF